MLAACVRRPTPLTSIACETGVLQRWFSDTPKATHTAWKFNDRARIKVSGGHGGRGVVSFEPLLRRKFKAAGGKGGRGGDVIIEASKGMPELRFQTYVFKGHNGTDASGKGKQGRAGKPYKIMVPVGTVVKEVHRTYHVDPDNLPGEYDYSDSDEDEYFSRLPRAAREEIALAAAEADRDYSDDMVELADLSEHGDRLVVCKGGEPGVGNRYLAGAERTPDTPHIDGQPGETRHLELELKIIADAGLVGYPNAGKSTLLRSISRAKPKVADYPFTTLRPVVGVINFRDTFRLTVADIPGLVDGAHVNRGLGHEFLRHIERCRALVYVLDLSDSSTDPVEDLRSLQHELYMYDQQLPQRPSIVVANKVETPEAEERCKLLRQSTMLPIIQTSALLGEHVGSVVDAIRWLVEFDSKQRAS